MTSQPLSIRAVAHATDALARHPEYRETFPIGAALSEWVRWNA